MVLGLGGLLGAAPKFDVNVQADCSTSGPEESPAVGPELWWARTGLAYARLPTGTGCCLGTPLRTL